MKHLTDANGYWQTGEIQNNHSGSKPHVHNLLRSTALIALLLTSIGLRAQDATENGYVFYYSGGDVYLNSPTSGTGNQRTAGTSAFNPYTCFWKGSSGSTFTNAAGFKWYNDSGGNFYVSTTNSSNVTFDNSNGGKVTVSGNTTYFCLGWFGDQFDMRSKNNQAISGLYSATKSTYNELRTNPTISGADEITDLGTASHTYSRASDAAFRPAYYNYRFRNADHFFASDNSTSLTAAPSAHAFTYSWSLTGIGSEYAEIDAGTGVVNYKKSTSGNVAATVTLTATSNTDNTVVLTATKAVTFKPLVDPESLSVTSANPMTVYAGNTGTIAYTLTPANCVENVTFASSNTGIATVTGSGVVTGVAVGEATITVTAKKLDDSTTPALTKTVTVIVKNKVATPVITFTPDATDNTKATAAISCTTAGATIYYKVNDGAYAIYTPGTTSITVTDGVDVVYAYAAMTGTDASYWDNSDTASETYVQCTTDDPTISYRQTTSTQAEVTITAETGTAIYYTTNGTEPTTSSSSGTSSVTFTTGSCTVKAYAKNGSCSKSSTVSKEIVLSGVSGGVVTLNDLEDHNWSYYSDASLPSKLRSLNPADVQITYFGNGKMYTSTTATPSGNLSNATGVKVGVDADEDTFIYYKTLERTDGSTAASVAEATGRCAYTTIPNPFSVRPTFTSGGTKYYTGFYTWRVKSLSGGSIYTAATGGTSIGEGGTIDAETEVFFAPTQSTGMKVELEAVWARAYVVTTNTTTGLNSGVTYERNFVVGATPSALNMPITYSSRYPDGTASTNVTVNGFTCSNDTKFEYMGISGTLTANNHYLCMGRGLTGTASNLQGISGGATDLNYTLRVESGSYTAFCFVRYNTNTTVSGRYLIKAIMGCDYDRATNTNDKLNVARNSNLFFSHRLQFSGSSNKDQKTFDCVFKSGTYQSDQWDDDQNGTNGYLHIAYLGQNSAYGDENYPGVRCVTVEGGELGGMCGGRGVSNNSNNSTYMTPEVITFDLRIKGGTFHGGVFGGAADNPSIGSRRFIMTGGEIWGWLAGGCNGTGSQTGSGATNGDSYIYVGGTALVGGDNAMCLQNTNGGQVFGAGRGYNDTRTSSVNYSYVAIADEAVICNNNNTANNPVGGNVYGGSYNGTIVNEANVYILGGTVQGGVYGGSYGNATDLPTANVTMTGGLVTNGVYGGSNSKGTVGNVKMHINGGQVGTSSAIANIHGGGYGSATRVSQNVDLTLGTTGQSTPGVTVYGDVYGGSALGYVNGTTATNTYHTYVTLNKGTINGSVYGGALGDASTPANVYGPVAVKVYGGTVNTTSANGSGAVYGCNNINGAPQRAVTVDIYGTDPAPSANTYALDAVYGGGNQADYTYGTPIVTVHNCDNSIAYVYGGGNAADITHDTDVTIYGGNKIGNVFGGGNGTLTAANVSGDTNVKIYGGTILKVFGGSNSKGSIGGTINVTAESQAENSGDTPCTLLVDELYGGGNMAPSNVGNITIGCMNDGDMINYVYGGSNDADITGAITLTMTGGRVERLFGGNNTGHSISGDIEVNVDWATGASACSDSYLGYVYGAGNKADFAHNTTVNIKNGTVTHDVFGGGLEASVAGNVAVNVTGGTVLGSLYGGGALADTNTDSGKTTKVTLSGGTVNDVYGGGLGQKSGFYGATSDIEAFVNGDVLVELNGSTESGATNDCVVTGNIFGCNNLNGTPKGTVTVHVYKTNGNGTTKVRTASGKLESPTESDHTYELAAVYGGGNMAAYEPTDAANGKTIVIIDGCDETSIEYVYGGGNAASVPATDVTINGTYEIGYVFGGGNGKDALPNGDPNPGADVGFDPNGAEYGSGQTLVNALGGTMHHVFGGSNTEGNIRTSATVNLDEAKDSNDDVICPLKVDEVYGGGNEALMAGGGNIVLGCITYLKEIYGGAKQADIGSSVSLTITSGHFDRVFGGNNLGGCIKGSITVNIEETGCNPITIGELYGCGNKAAYSVYGYETDGTVKTSGDSPYANPTLNIKSFKSIGRVFGGGLGTKAVVVGNPTVNVNEIVGANASAASVYAGTTRTLSDGSTVTLPAHTAGEMGVIGEVFGGGNAAGVIGDTNVNIATKKKISLVSGSDHSDKDVKGANITGNIYGGGNAADVTGKTNVTIGQP